MKKINIFCSYAHKDQRYFHRLKTHLASLERHYPLTVWSFLDISPGRRWDQEIQDHLGSAQIVLLLISPDFLASDYCYSEEMKHAIELHERGEARVIPIILRPVSWQGTPFGNLQALPPGAEPVTRWRKQEDAFFAITTALKKVIEELSPKRITRPLDKPTAKPSIDLTLFETGISDPSRKLFLYYPIILDRPGDPAKVWFDTPLMTKIEAVNSAGCYPEGQRGTYDLLYSYHRDDKTIVIKPDLPYLNHLAQGGPIYGHDYDDSNGLSPFPCGFLWLSIKVLNTSDETCFLSEAAIQVEKSEIRIEPVPVISRPSPPEWELQIVNEGWGKIINPRITFQLAARGTYLSSMLNEWISEKYERQMQTFTDMAMFSLKEYLPDALRSYPQSTYNQYNTLDSATLKIFGNISYQTEAYDERLVRFETEPCRLSLHAPFVEPTYTYDVFLQAGRSGYTQHLSLAQEIKPGSSDHFLFRMASDKSALFHLTFSFRAVDEREIQSRKAILDIFVSRSEGHYRRRRSEAYRPFCQ